jgi:hypothetical protein
MFAQRKTILNISLGVLLLFSFSLSSVKAKTEINQRIRIVLAYPDPASISVPAGLDREGVDNYTIVIFHQQVQALLVELNPYLSNGSIADIQELPDLNSITMTVKDRNTLTALNDMAIVADAQTTEENPFHPAGGTSNGSNEMLSINRTSSGLSNSAAQDRSTLSALGEMKTIARIELADKIPSECTRAAASNLRDEISAVSAWRQAVLLRQKNSANQMKDALQPDIHINFDNIPQYIEGNAGIRTVVNLRVLRSGIVVGKDSSTSNNDGGYIFWPSSNDYGCAPGKQWELHPGDIVEISANGYTLQTEVVNLVGYAYAEGQLVEGTAPVGRSAVARLIWYESSNLCQSVTTQSATVPVNADGSFSLPVSIAFNRSVSGFVEALDSNGNGTYQSFKKYDLVGNRWGGYGGHLQPYTSFSIQQRRDGDLLATQYGVTDSSGYYYNYFDGQPGDELALTAGAITMKQVIIVEPIINVDSVNNIISGTTTPGVAMHLSGADGSLEPVHCSSGDYACMSQVADSSGNFSFHLSQPIDDLSIGVSFMTQEGEGWNMYSSAPTTLKLLALADWGTIQGRWYSGTAPLTVRVLDGEGTEQRNVTVQRPESTDSFTAATGSAIPYGWQVEVSDGTHTETMSIGLDNVNADQESHQISGSGLAGHLKVSNAVLCLETDITTEGPFSLGGSEIPAPAGLYVFHTSDDGFQTRRDTYIYDYPMTFSYYPGEWQVDGHFDAPYGVVTAYLMRGETQLASGIANNTNPYAEGYFGITLTPSAYVYQTGDSITLVKPDASSITVQLPYGTVNLDAAGRRVFGQAPSNTIIQAGVGRNSPGGTYKYLPSTVVDADGNYSVSIPSDAIWQMYNCNPVDPTQHCVYPWMTYVSPEKYHFSYFGQQPQPEAADGYESDDSAATASTYTEPQRHTIHVENDFDWVKFEVTQADVDNQTVFRISTYDLGWDMGTFVELRDGSGSNYLLGAYDVNQDNRGSGALIRGYFTTAGTYMLRIYGYIPFEGNWYPYGGYCDSIYTVGINRETRLYLPMIGN